MIPQEVICGNHNWARAGSKRQRLRCFVQKPQALHIHASKKFGPNASQMLWSSNWAQCSKNFSSAMREKQSAVQNLATCKSGSCRQAQRRKPCITGVRWHERPLVWNAQPEGKASSFKQSNLSLGMLHALMKISSKACSDELELSLA